jgi:hypothetical protein
MRCELSDYEWTAIKLPRRAQMRERMAPVLQPHSRRRVEIQSIRDVAIGSIARLPHQATSSPKLWLSR